MANPASIKPVDLPKIELEDDGLIDEDSLLTEEDRKRPDLPVAVTIPSKPPCKKVEMCGLGDAFRCSACPVKGIPPFILDEKAGCAVDFTNFERHCDFDRCKQEDAFRCSAFPFKGLPSLKTGNKYICWPSSVKQTTRLVRAICGIKFWYRMVNYVML